MEIVFSQACENNKQPILDKINVIFKDTTHVLEIGAGSGQHGVFFAENLPHLTWQPSDLLINHPHINHHIDAAQLTNICRPIEIDLSQPWPIANISNSKTINAIFCANTLHIVSWALVQSFFKAAGSHLTAGEKLCLYGPFNYQGKYTSESNAKFDMWLKNRDPQSAIRNMEDITKLAVSAGLSLSDDHKMPANNRLLVFIKN